jgi:hypothetical protein
VTSKCLSIAKVIFNHYIDFCISFTTDSVSAIVSAIEALADSKGLASHVTLKKFFEQNYPQWPKMTFMGAIKRALAKGRIRQVKASYKVLPQKEGKPSRPEAGKKRLTFFMGLI